jgi:hypothetical protein
MVAGPIEMSDVVLWFLVALLATHVVTLTAVATLPEVRTWYRAHYRAYAAFTVLTSILVMIAALSNIAAN